MDSIMDVEQKRLEEIMVALSLCFMGRDGYRVQQAVAEEVKRVCPRGPVWNGRLPVTQENVGSNPIEGAAG